MQTIYIDPPFNLDSSDQFLYRTNYKDANWATLLENRLKLAKDVLNKRGSIFVRCDYNGNWIVRCLMSEIFGEENFRNELVINKSNKQGAIDKRFNPATETLFLYSKIIESLINPQFRKREKQGGWLEMHSPKENKDSHTIIFNGKSFIAPKGRHWSFAQGTVDKLTSENRIRVTKKQYIDVYGNRQSEVLEYLMSEDETIESNWTDIPGYSTTTGFQTENSERLLARVINTGSQKDDLILDFFLGSGTTTAVAHKLNRKWLGVEMGEHFYTRVLPRMKKVLAYDKSGISKEVKEYQGGGFFKYYELEQYEEALANCKYEESDLFSSPSKTPYQEYVFMKDEKMLKALEIDYENDKVKVDLTKLYPNIDIAETLSNLTGRWIKKISDVEVEFEDGTKINTKDLDYKLIKPLIWW
ncbi:MAG: Modification methylase MboII [candidate division WS2 bacterium]|uniref:Modification methylase MboII n=1 Tax=Psychracetigena formicireducens TaxID=2986056 RepID=A0A9E2BHG2_PSYF1|nr:Modification methylase MboII [Candidatus Psychracetigena formicireducens]